MKERLSTPAQHEQIPCQSLTASGTAQFSYLKEPLYHPRGNLIYHHGKGSSNLGEFF